MTTMYVAAGVTPDRPLVVPPPKMTAIPSSPATNLPLVAGRYQSLRLLGTGTRKFAMLAWDRHEQRNVALLLYRPDVTRKWEDLMWPQLRLAAALPPHPNVLRVLDVGEDEWEPGYRRRYSVAELVPNPMTLDDRRERGPCSTAGVLRIAYQVAHGLGHLHAAGLTHGSPSPHNLMVSGQRVIVADFDWLKRIEDSSIYGNDDVYDLGAFGALTPEEIQGQPYEVRSDLHRLGSTLYAMATSHPPFVDRSEPAGRWHYLLVTRRLNSLPQPPSATNPAINAELDDLILWMMRPDPDARPQSADAVIAAVEHIAGRLGVSLGYGGEA